MHVFSCPGRNKNTQAFWGVLARIKSSRNEGKHRKDFEKDRVLGGHFLSEKQGFIFNSKSLFMFPIPFMTAWQSFWHLPTASHSPTDRQHDHRTEEMKHLGGVRNKNTQTLKTRIEIKTRTCFNSGGGLGLAMLPPKKS